MANVKRNGLVTFIGPVVAGTVAWMATDEWRWPVTGLLVGAGLLAVAVAVGAFLDTDLDAGGPGCALVLLAFFGLGPLGELAAWLWTGNPYWGLGALLTPLLAVVVIGTLSTLG